MTDKRQGAEKVLSKGNPKDPLFLDAHRQEL